MISAFVGKIRNGKSYFACKLILDKIASGGVVFSNMSIRLDPWHDKSYGHDSIGAKAVLKKVYDWDYQDGQFNYLSDDNVKDLTKYISSGTSDMPVLVVIDEALDFFNSLDRHESQTVLREFLSFIRHSGKFFTDLVFITQSFDEMNNRLRDKISDYYICADVAKTPFPFPVSVIAKVFFNRYFVVTRKIGKQSNPEIVKRYWIKKDYLIYQSYETTSLHMNLVLGCNVKSDFRKNGGLIMKKYQEFLLYASLCLSFFVFFRSSPSKASSPAGSGVPAVIHPSIKTLSVSDDVSFSVGGSSSNDVSISLLPAGDLTKSQESFSFVSSGSLIGAYLPRYRKTLFIGDFIDDGEVVSVEKNGVVLRKSSGGVHVFYNY